MKIQKRPLYVEVYEKIYDQIISNDIKRGEQLPGEHVLSKQYNVSRSTLRQALLLLKENGIIYNKQGKGNFVMPWESQSETGLEKLIPIPVSFSKGEITDNLINVLYEVPNSYLMKKLQLDKSTLLMSCHKTYSVNGTISCYSLYNVSTKVLTESNLDFHDKDAISKFVETDMIKSSSKSVARIVSTEAGEFLVDIMNVRLNEKILMIEELFYDVQGRPIALTRHSILPEYFDFNLTRSGI